MVDNYIKEYREKNQITQIELANLTNRSRSLISKLECGVKPLSQLKYETVCNFARVLGLDDPRALFVDGNPTNKDPNDSRSTFEQMADEELETMPAICSTTGDPEECKLAEALRREVLMDMAKRERKEQSDYCRKAMRRIEACQRDDFWIRYAEDRDFKKLRDDLYLLGKYAQV